MESKKKTKYPVASVEEVSLTADEDVLLCNWDFITRVTFDCLSLAAWQDVMTAKNVIFKAFHFPSVKSECFFNAAETVHCSGYGTSSSFLLHIRPL